MGHDGLDLDTMRRLSARPSEGTVTLIGNLQAK